MHAMAILPAPRHALFSNGIIETTYLHMIDASPLDSSVRYPTLAIEKDNSMVHTWYDRL